MTTLNARRRRGRARGRRPRADRRDRLRAARPPARAGAAPAGCAAEVDAAAVPAIDGVLELLADATSARSPAARGATARTPRRFTTFADGVPEARRWLRLRRDDLRRPAGRRPPSADGLSRLVIGRLVAGDAGTISVSVMQRGPAGRRRPGRPAAPDAPPRRSDAVAACAADIATTATAITSVPSRSPSCSSPRAGAQQVGHAQAASSPAPRPLRAEGHGRRTRPRPRPRMPPTPRRGTARARAIGPWRSSSRQPKSPIAEQRPRARTRCCRR